MELWNPSWKRYFRPDELLSPQGVQQFKKGNLLLQPDAIDKLVAIRRAVAMPFKCNHAGLLYRGYRSPWENQNKIDNPSPFSRHIQGIAFDITVEGLSPLAFFYVLSKIPEVGGIGLYNSFCHIDFRPRVDGEFHFWDYRK